MQMDFEAAWKQVELTKQHVNALFNKNYTSHIHILFLEVYLLKLKSMWNGKYSLKFSFSTVSASLIISVIPCSKGPDIFK